MKKTIFIQTLGRGKSLTPLQLQPSPLITIKPRQGQCKAQCMTLSSERYTVTEILQIRFSEYFIVHGGT